LSTQIEHLENHTARLTVDVAPERVDKAMHDAARRIAREVNIPGFRKGKAPYNIVLQRVGQKAVLGEAIELLGNEVFREALDEAKIEPYAPGNLENVETEPTMKLVFVVPKQPEVDLGQYREIRQPFEAPEVEDTAVTRAMKSLQERRAVIEPATRPAQMSDRVKVYVHGERIHPADELGHEEEPDEEKTGDEAATPEGQEAHAEHEADKGQESHEEQEGHEAADAHEGHKDTFIDQELDVVLAEDDDEESVIPGFSSNLVGLSAAEKKSFTLSFPEDYKDQGLARHTFNFDVEMKEVQSRTLPAQNDEFAKLVTDNEVDNLLELRIRVRKDLQDAAKREAESKYAEEVLDKVVEQAQVKYPEEMVDEYIDDILQSLDRNLRERGLSLEHYKRLENKDDATLRADYREMAIQRLKRALILGEIVRREQLDVNDSDVETQIDKMSQQFGEQAAIFRQMLARAENRRGIAVDLVTSRAFQRLIEIARGENPPIGASPAKEEPEAEAKQPAPEIGVETPAETIIDITAQPAQSSEGESSTSAAESSAESPEAQSAAE
jgi:trigger factor